MLISARALVKRSELVNRLIEVPPKKMAPSTKDLSSRSNPFLFEPATREASLEGLLTCQP